MLREAISRGVDVRDNRAEPWLLRVITRLWICCDMPQTPLIWENAALTADLQRPSSTRPLGPGRALVADAGRSQRMTTARPRAPLPGRLTASPTWAKDRAWPTGLRSRCAASLKSRSASSCPLGATTVGTKSASVPKAWVAAVSVTDVALAP